LWFGSEKLKRVFWRLVRPIKQKLIRASKRPREGSVGWGGLRSLSPISRDFGFERGTPIDRYYIEQFLARHAEDIRGRVMEVGTDMYTVRYGGGRVTRNDVTHHAAGNPRATMVLDLTDAGHLSDQLFDCIICTQTLQFIFDVRAAIVTLHRLLKPRGVLLMTTSGICQISQADMRATGDFWRFTEASLRRLLTGSFPDAQCEVRAYGNVVSSIAFLHGIVVEELSEEELDTQDADYQLLLTARAVKPA
jgi:SAM-dependent methyltransferase